MKYIIPRRVPFRGLIVAKGNEQIGKWLDGDIQRGNRFVQRDENRVRRLSRAAIAQFQVPLVEKRQGSYRIGNFVSQVIGPAAVGVQIVKMLVQPARQQPGNHIEIFVMMRGQPAGISLSLRDGASGRRKPACYFEFGGYLHGAGRRATGTGFSLRVLFLLNIKPTG
jgi:hypothetical protein